MALSKQEWLALEKKANELRNLTLDTTHWAGSGHIGGGLSVMDILTVCYHKYMHIRPDDPQWEDRDRLILSKGHAGIAYAPVLCDLGYNDPEMLKTFNLSGSKMGTLTPTRSRALMLLRVLSATAFPSPSAPRLRREFSKKTL